LQEWYPGTQYLTEEELLNLEESIPGSPMTEIEETFKITRTFSTIEMSPTESKEDSRGGDLRHQMDSSIKRKVSMVSIVSLLSILRYKRVKSKHDIERSKMSIFSKTLLFLQEAEATKEVTPPRSAPSPIIIVTNLVRPFTVPQLRELLQRTGNVVDLWVDKIKSKCVAKVHNKQ
jgi:hypothetical protein